MGITDFFMKMHVATGGKDPNAATRDALRALGLQPTRQEGAYSELAGQGWGLLRLPELERSWIPHRIEGVDDAVAIDGACALTRAGQVYCWGVPWPGWST